MREQVADFDWRSIPAWVWIALAVAAVIVTPIKFRVWKKLLARKGPDESGE